MKVRITRNSVKTTFYPKEKTCFADDVLKQNGFVYVNVLEIEGYESIKWEGIEFNRLFARDGALWRFNEWIDNFKGVEAEIIGEIE